MRAGWVALPGAQGVLVCEIPLQLEMLATVERQIAEVERRMQECLETTPDGRALLSIPKLGAPDGRGVPGLHR